jgi:hypothetical protein
MRVRTFVLPLIAICWLVKPAQAQSAFELGYQLAHIPDETLPIGVSFGVLGRWTPSWNIVGEVAVARESHAIPGVEADFTIFDIGGGVRWTPQVVNRLEPFVQIIVGATRRSVNFDPELGPSDPIREELAVLGLDFLFLDESETDFMVQPGVGLSYRLTDGWSALAAIKFTETLNQDEFDIGDEYRLFFGVRMDF